MIKLKVFMNIKKQTARSDDDTLSVTTPKDKPPNLKNLKSSLESKRSSNIIEKIGRLLKVYSFSSDGRNRDKLKDDEIVSSSEERSRETSEGDKIDSGLSLKGFLGDIRNAIGKSESFGGGEVYRSPTTSIYCYSCGVRIDGSMLTNLPRPINSTNGNNRAPEKNINSYISPSREYDEIESSTFGIDNSDSLGAKSSYSCDVTTEKQSDDNGSFREDMVTGHNKTANIYDPCLYGKDSGILASKERKWNYATTYNSVCVADNDPTREFRYLKSRFRPCNNINGNANPKTKHRSLFNGGIDCEPTVADNIYLNSSGAVISSSNDTFGTRRAEYCAGGGDCSLKPNPKSIHTFTQDHRMVDSKPILHERKNKTYSTLCAKFSPCDSQYLLKHEMDGQLNRKLFTLRTPETISEGNLCTLNRSCSNMSAEHLHKHEGIEASNSSVSLISLYNRSVTHHRNTSKNVF